MVCEDPRRAVGPRRSLLVLAVALRASCSPVGSSSSRGSISDTAVASSLAAEEDLAADALADEVFCPVSLIQTALRQVRLRDGADGDEAEEGDAEAPSPPPAADGAKGGRAEDAAGASEKAAHLPGSSVSAAAPPTSIHNQSARAKTNAHGASPRQRVGGKGAGAPRAAEPWEDSRTSAADAAVAPGARPPAGVAAVRRGRGAAGFAGARGPIGGQRRARVVRSRINGWRRRVRLAARRDARLALMLCLLVILLTIVTVMTVRSLSLGMRRRGEGGARERAIKAIPLCGLREVEEWLPLPSAGGGYCGALSRQTSAGQPVRLEARVLGPVEGSATLVAPLTQRACVLYEVSVSRLADAKGRRGPALVARSARSADFVVALADAPEVHVELRGDEVSLFGMCGGLCTKRRPVAGAPEHWAAFADAHSVAAVEEADPEEAVDFREAALLVDSTVTLVGDLHRSVTGALSLWPWHGEAGELKPREVPEVEAEAGTKEPWRTSWERSVCRSAEEAEEDEELCFGAVLVSDDPALLDGPGRAGCGLWRRCFGERTGKTPAASACAAGLSTTKSGG